MNDVCLFFDSILSKSFGRLSRSAGMLPQTAGEQIRSAWATTQLTMPRRTWWNVVREALAREMSWKRCVSDSWISIRA
jgi:hypothetical protein